MRETDVRKTSMENKKSKPRRKARHSSIYRKLELLLCETMTITERIPKHAQGLQTVGVRMINETLEALSVTEFGIQAPDNNSRLTYIATLIHCMTLVKTCCRELYAYSRKDRTEPKIGKDGMVVTNGQGQTETMKSPRYGRVISHTQYVNLLQLFSELGKEIGRWFNATRWKVSQSHVSA